MFRVFGVLFGAAAIAYLCLCAALFFSQRSMIYFPNPGSANPTLTRFPLQAGAERVLVSTLRKDSLRSVIYFGGNAEDVSGSLPELAAAFPSSAIYLLHYRGYGGSSGAPSEKALFADALMLYEKVATEHSQIDVVGRSLGSGIAVYVASLRPVARLVLVTPFDSLQELASRQFPYIPVRWILKDKFESWRYAPNVSAPTLILAAEYDEVMPRASTELLRTRFRTGLVSYKIIPGATHNTISISPEYAAALKGPP